MKTEFQIMTFRRKNETSKFPIDMLRYDCCWPATQKDVTAIINGCSEVEVITALTQFSVELMEIIWLGGSKIKRNNIFT
jgi:hypothetical protein